MSERRNHVRHVALLLVAVGCATDRPDDSGRAMPAGPTGAVPVEEVKPQVVDASRNIEMKKKVPSGGGLVIELEDGVPPPPPEVEAAPAPKIDMRALSADEAKPLIARLPAIGAKDGDVKRFALRASTRKLPLSGAQTKGVFPPKIDRPKPPKPKIPPLRIERVQPTGEVGLAPHVSVTFSQPMVPVSSVDQVLSKPPPVKLSPAVEGQWRWAGARTLLFEPKPRFAMATAYTLKIPAGLTSELGGKLQEPEQVRFGTPPPKITSFSPSGTTDLTPALYVAFDQRIDPKEVVKKISVRAGSRAVGVRLASDEERKKAGYSLATGPLEPRSVVMLLKKKLPKATKVKVTFAKGIPSAEGPRRSKKARTFSFQTYGPFRFVKHRCGWGRVCRPRMQFSLEFTNSLGNFDAKMVKIEPPIEDVKINQYGRQIQINGKTIGRTTYRVRIGRELEDDYEQKLEKAVDVTFSVGPAEPSLQVPGPQMMVLERTSKPSLSAYSINYDKLDVRLSKVSEKDWYKFLDYKQRHRQKSPPPMPGKIVFDGTVDVAAQADRLIETKIDLGPALEDRRGMVIAEILPHGWKPNPNRSWYWPGALKWIQVTPLAVDAMIDRDDLYAFASYVQSGKPVDAKVTVLPQGLEATAEDGLAKIALPDSGGNDGGMLVVRHEKDVAFLPESMWPRSGSSWRKQKVNDTYRYFTFDDRKLYRPKETAHVKGFIRRLTNGKGGDVVALGKHGGVLEYAVRDARGNEFAKGKTKLSKLGGFSFSVDFPDDINLGYANVSMNVPGLGSKRGYSGSHSLRVEEFRRPEFEVSVSATEGPHLVGQYGVFSARAAYFTGGPLADADTRWNISVSPGSYTPPGRSGFVFGSWSPWWWGRHKRGYYRGPRSGRNHSFSGKTGADGEHHVRVELLGMDPPKPSVVSAEASVTDVNRQTFSDRSSILVHPADRYVGLRVKRYFVEQNKRFEVDVVNVDLDGKAQPSDKVEVTFQREGDKDEDKQTCKPEAAEAKCEFSTTKGGRYRLLARTEDDRGRKNESSMYIWVSGAENVPTDRSVREEQAQLIPDKQEYAVGDVAEILVQSPFADAEGVYLLEREGVVKTQRFTIEGASTVLKIPLEDAYVPNIHLDVVLVGRQKRRNAKGEVDDSLPKRPAYAAATLDLKIPAKSRTLTVTTLPAAKETEPGSKTSVVVDVKHHDGKPAAGAEVTLFVVDEAVLALAAYQTPDPIATFYTNRAAYTRKLRSRQYVYLADPEDAAASAKDLENEVAAEEKSMAPKKKSRARRSAKPAALSGVADMAMGESAGPGGGGGGAASTPIAVRKDFSALAKFEPAVTTDSRGRAKVDLTMPDSLTRYRVVAVAAHGANHFGHGESSITARKALMVRPSPPRFLNYGDEIELPVVLENRTASPITAQVVVRGTNADVQAVGFEVKLDREARAEVRFPTAAAKPGRARFQFAAAAGAYADAAEVDIPVWTPATTEAFATYGEIDKGAALQPVLPPPNVAKEFGGLEITTASTQLQALTDAYIYILSYPYGCAEQISSRVLSTAALRDVLVAFDAEGMPPEDEVIAAVGRDIKRLGQLQNTDGGWGWWRRGRPSRVFLTTHVMHALVRAEQKKFEVPKRMRDRGHQFLKKVDQYISREKYSPAVRRTLVAYALYVRAMMGDIDSKRAKQLIRSAGGVSKLPLESAAWLYPVATDAADMRGELAELRRLFNNRATETAATAHFATSYQDGGHVLLHSSRRVDALILEGMMRDQPKNVLITKLVRGLLAHRTRGRWANTQENAWVLVALDRYFRQYEKVTPDFVARIWLGEGFAGEKQFKGRTTDQHLIEIPMEFIAGKPKQDLLIHKDGPGRLYYRVGLKYAPEDLNLKAANYGFEVARNYEAIDDPGDVKKGDDGVWRIKAGARVRVTVSMVNTARRYHVALVDPLPAGLEPINAGLAGTAGVPAARPNESNPWFWWRRWWYVHDNLRDERAEAFSTTLWPGRHTYTYAARATTPGRFVVPPTKAEEMYFPETFGRSATDRVIIE